MAIYEPKPMTEWTPGQRVDHYRRLLRQAERDERTIMYRTSSRPNCVVPDEEDDSAPNG